MSFLRRKNKKKKKPAESAVATRNTDDPFDHGKEFKDPVESYRMPLLEHLAELRVRLMWAGGAAIVGCLVSFAFVQDIWDFLVAPMNNALLETERGTMAMTEPLEGFMTYLKVAGLAGVTLTSPIIFWHGWKFVAPGLYPKEQRFILPLVVSSTALFLGGAAFAYYVIFYYAFPYFLVLTTDDVEAVLSIHSYLKMVIRMLLAMGFCFQLPVIVYFLARGGLVHHRDMIKGFRYSVVGIFVIAAMLTPPDPASQALMAGPLLVLYGVGIIVAWIFSTKELEPST